ncbi:hypothetical protein [Brachybacterium sp. ACRRE]|uniref:hypothetical protein n=1 Tax=Brachybacterium sp. ACRRE TaxID=2918184 RepID=UPI001EF362BE|nr:hypothetical protein [Brachybacterium sp. ACRRE]MCG7308297.1 hypothetical protein [Brachybacterium sp. ACRRE]
MAANGSRIRGGSGNGARVLRKRDTGEQGNSGQFGTHSRDEADIRVGTDDDGYRYLTVGWWNDKLQDHFDASALLTRAEVDASAELLDENEVFERIQRDAERLCRRRGAMEHVDDVIGDTAHDIIKRIRESEDREGHVRAVATASLVRRIVSGHLNHRLSSGEVERSEVRSGQVRLAQRVAQKEQELGRELSGREKDRLAAEVRLTFPTNNRPPEDFHVARKDRFLSVDDEDSGASNRLSVPADDSVLDEQPLTPFPEAIDRTQMDASEMLYFVQNKDESPMPIHSRNTSTTIYNTLAQSMRIPPAQPDSLSHRQAMNAGRTVRSHERGVQGVCADYLDGARDERTEALFLPFGEIDDERREAFASQFETSPYADEMWGSALKCADPQLKNFEFPSQLEDR